MVAAFTFPGQGSQCVGMGKELAERFPEARLVFEEVDDALGEKLSKIIFDGPDNELMLTANAQPAIMAVSIAVLRVLEAQGFRITDHVGFVAGHSLGEYSALCAAGMFSLRDTARLLRVRGSAMQEAVALGDGAMAAIIGLSEPQVAAICDRVSASGVCQIANDNGATQLVISGLKAAVQDAITMAQSEGALRALLLAVSAPFHCSLMAPAASVMRDALSKVEHSRLKVPLVANVSVEPETDETKIIDLLVHQITGRVRWRETVEWFAQHNISDLYEIGYGRVLSGLARRISKEIKPISVYSAQDIEEALKNFNV